MEHQFMQQTIPGQRSPESAYLEKYNNLKQDTLTSLFQHTSISAPQKEQPLDMA